MARLLLTITLTGDYPDNQQFRPKENAAFSVTRYGSYCGEFSALAGADLGFGLVLEPVYEDTGLTLIARFTGVVGDMDGSLALNNLDIAPFALALADPDAYCA